MRREYDHRVRWSARKAVIFDALISLALWGAITAGCLLLVRCVL